MNDFFAHPGPAYNALSLIFGVLGLLLGIAGLLFAFWQIAKTLDAATAAKLAAQSATVELRRVATVIDSQKLSGYCREIRASVGAGRLWSVSRPLHDLRMGLAELRATAQGRQLCRSHVWDAMIASVAEVQRRIETSSGGEP